MLSDKWVGSAKTQTLEKEIEQLRFQQGRLTRRRGSKRAHPSDERRLVWIQFKLELRIQELERRKDD